MRPPYHLPAAGLLVLLICLWLLLPGVSSAQSPNSSQVVTWTCTGSPCPWGSALSGQALVWPAGLGPTIGRLGYTTSAGVYLPASAASGTTVGVTAGTAGVYSGLPNAGSHRLLATLGAGQSYTVGSLPAGEVISVQADYTSFAYTLTTITPTATPLPTATATPLPTETPTLLPTATATPLPTETPTLLPTATATPLPTETPTFLPTATATPLPTETPTLPPTATATPLPTETPTLPPTATPTLLPTATVTPLPTATATTVPSDSLSQSVVWTCTSSPCPWGTSLSGQALVWPAGLGPTTGRLGYTTSAGVYLPDNAASGLTVGITSGTAGVYAGLPNAGSHRLLATLGAGQSYTVAGLVAGEVVSVQGSETGFTYLPVAPVATITPPLPTATPTILPTETPALPTETPVATTTPALTTETPTILPTETPTLPAETPTLLPTETATLLPTATPTSLPTATATPLPTATPNVCVDPLACNPVSSLVALWRCNVANCMDADWTGTVINWPSWAAYATNARSGIQSRTVFSVHGEMLYPYMGAWANGCQVTAVAGTVLIIEWKRGADVWRETYLAPGQSHTISLMPNEDGAMIESPTTEPISVILNNCNPQNIQTASTPTPTPMGIVEMGEKRILNDNHSGVGNVLVAQQTTLTQTATLQGLSFYVARPAGQLVLGIYDDAGGRPGTLRAQTAIFTPGAGWNTHNVQTPAQLTPGTYWLAFLSQSSSLAFKGELTGTGLGFSQPFGALPATPPALAGGGAMHWSFYATLQTAAGGQVQASGQPAAAGAAEGGSAVYRSHLFLPFIQP